MENNKKHIAAIFEEQKVFITYGGSCYQYAKEQGVFRCHKMDKLRQKVFWKNYRQQTVAKEENLTSWRPVAENKENLPGNHRFERQFTREISELSKSRIILKFQDMKSQLHLDK